MNGEDHGRQHLRELFDIFSPAKIAAALQGATVYHAALAAIICRNCKGQELDGHRFAIETESRVMGRIVLRATDAFDGKRYRVIVEPE